MGIFRKLIPFRGTNATTATGPTPEFSLDDALATVRKFKRKLDALPINQQSGEPIACSTCGRHAIWKDDGRTLLVCLCLWAEIKDHCEPHPNPTGPIDHLCGIRIEVG